jgi:predicted metal-dependent peptidase
MKMVLMEKLDKFIRRLCFEESFFSALSIHIDKRFIKDDKITAYVAVKKDSDIELVINENFWDTLTEDQKYGIIKHELYHISFFHLFKMMENKALDNIAKDIVVNQYIPANMLPPGAATIEQFAHLNLPPLQDFMTYYNILMQNQDDKKVKQYTDAYNEMGGGDLRECQDGDEGEQSDAKKYGEAQLKNNMKKIFNDVLKRNRGKIPAGLESIMDYVNTAVVDELNWKEKLKYFATAARRVKIHLTRNKLNKRLGMDYPGTNIKRKTKVLVAIDTSGSVADEELMKFMEQVYLMSKTDCEITIVECDAKMYEPWLFNKKRKIKFKGRGGTSFDPVLEYFNKEPYNGLIYFTDGYCSTSISTNKKILWVVTSGGTMEFEAPGNKVQIKN